MATNWLFPAVAFLLASPLALPQLRAQRVYLRGPDLVLEDAHGRRNSLGPGFNPVPLSEHTFLLIRGSRMGYGEDSSCERSEAKNRVVIYDTITNTESILFDKPLPVPLLGRDAACVYEQADLSPSESTLYIVSPCYATSGCLAVINLSTGVVRYVPGVMDVFVIRGGPRAGDLIYSRRSFSKPTRYDSGHPYYPYVHARRDGSIVTVISDENLVLVGGNALAPILRGYLRHIQGRIFVQGEWVP